MGFSWLKIIVMMLGAASWSMNSCNCDVNEQNTKFQTCVLRNISSGELCADCSFRNLTRIPEDLTSHITCLNLVGNNFTSLKGTTWKRFSLLKKLSLARNHIPTIENDDFMGLPKLEMLDLSLNKIHYHMIGQNAFEPLVSLKYLDIKQNITKFHLNEIYPTSLRYVHNLTTLMIDGLPEQTLPRIPRLSKLFFSGQYGRCHIPYLKREIFLNNPQLQSIYLSNCSIVTIEPNISDIFPEIQDLDLSWNTQLGLSNVSIGLRSNTSLKCLKRLNLDSVFEYFKFDHCSSLKKEDLIYLNFVEVFSVAGNNIVRVEDDALPYFPKKLKYLSIQDNMLMYGNYVDEIFERGIFRNIIYYDTSKMFISHTPKSFVRNKTQIFKAKETDLQTTEEYGNAEMFTSQQFKDFFTILNERLRKYEIGPNSTAIDSKNENKIQYLDLSENMPGTVEVNLKLFEDSPFLKFLNISNNFLGYQLLDDTTLLQKYNNLRYLDLSRNSIIHLLSGTFNGQVNLEQLYLSFNKISNITFLMNSLYNLKYLDLSFNHLESISIQERMSMDNLANFSVNLANNTFRCTCDDLDFLKWVKNTRIRFENLEDTACSLEDGKTVTLDKLDYQQLHVKCSPPTFHTLILVVSLCILAFVIIVSCGLIYRFKWNLRYLYYMTKFKLAGGYQPIDDREYDKDVFVSYANEDRGFVRQQVVQELENDGNISLLVHDRDFRAGEFVADNIMRAITSTRRTLVILTTAYINSKWCMYELNMARMEAADTGRNVLCVVLKEDIPVKYLPIEIIDVIKKKTYIEFPLEIQHIEGFWERLRGTLRHDL